MAGFAQVAQHSRAKSNRINPAALANLIESTIYHKQLLPITTPGTALRKAFKRRDR
jgi:hypothetical protein